MEFNVSYAQQKRPTVIIYTHIDRKINMFISVECMD